ncbi:uncharacterized protein IL334_007968 [Kwoniella shivajii]|uniref:Protein kinase domain-containing protein n=1 Tax=Kwoniella shivajii TaxID=564305 RepID=A0ABZ1DCE5_9TREE|nr:hypothetical protein IL334_007968 [Kwoniella shivajii]
MTQQELSSCSDSQPPLQTLQSLSNPSSPSNSSNPSSPTRNSHSSYTVSFLDNTATIPFYEYTTLPPGYLPTTSIGCLFQHVLPPISLPGVDRLSMQADTPMPEFPDEDVVPDEDVETEKKSSKSKRGRNEGEARDEHDSQSRRKRVKGKGKEEGNPSTSQGPSTRLNTSPKKSSLQKSTPASTRRPSSTAALAFWQSLDKITFELDSNLLDEKIDSRLKQLSINHSTAATNSHFPTFMNTWWSKMICSEGKYTYWTEDGIQAMQNGETFSTYQDRKREWVKLVDIAGGELPVTSLIQDALGDLANEYVKRDYNFHTPNDLVRRLWKFAGLVGSGTSDLDTNEILPSSTYGSNPVQPDNCPPISVYENKPYMSFRDVVIFMGLLAQQDVELSYSKEKLICTRKGGANDLGVIRWSELSMGMQHILAQVVEQLHVNRARFCVLGNYDAFILFYLSATHKCRVSRVILRDPLDPERSFTPQFLESLVASANAPVKETIKTIIQAAIARKTFPTTTSSLITNHQASQTTPLSLFTGLLLTRPEEQPDKMFVPKDIVDPLRQLLNEEKKARLGGKQRQPQNRSRTAQSLPPLDTQPQSRSGPSIFTNLPAETASSTKNEAVRSKDPQHSSGHISRDNPHINLNLSRISYANITNMKLRVTLKDSSILQSNLHSNSDGRHRPYHQLPEHIDTSRWSIIAASHPARVSDVPSLASDVSTLESDPPSSPLDVRSTHHDRRSTMASVPVLPGLTTQPEATIQLSNYLSGGRLYDVYLANITLKTKSYLDQDGILVNNSKPIQVVVKIINLDSFPTRIEDVEKSEDTSYIYTKQEAESAVMKESYILVNILSSSSSNKFRNPKYSTKLHGVVPHYYGLWESSNGKSKIMMMVLEYCGESVFQKNEELTGDTINEILDAYDTVHSSGVVHDDVQKRHILRHPQDQGIVIIDFEAASWRPAETDLDNLWEWGNRRVAEEDEVHELIGLPTWGEM